jgi:hypothetical protein
LAPPLFKALWENDGWSHGIPADTVARSHLKLERNLNDQSARSLLSIFKENVQFAGLRPGGTQLVVSDPEPTPAQNAERTSAMSKGTAPFVPLSERPIVFDMESVTVSIRVSTQSQMRKLIFDLERLEPLLPDDEVEQ